MKVIDGETKLATPIACDDGTSMGVGLAYNGRTVFWGLAAPKKVITSYRGMKIAEQVREFGPGTLAACWCAGSRNVHESDKRYVDEIEAKIGRPARERILGMVPENFEDILGLLQEKDIHFAGWEIDEEVKNGVLRVTPKIQSYLDDFHRKQEILRQEKYGRIITPEEAREGIATAPFVGEVGKAFVEAYNQHVDPNTQVGIKHSDVMLSENYVVGKSRTDPRVEMTIKGGLADTLIFGFSPILEIGFEYDGRDVSFQPRVPQKPVGLFYRLGLKKAKEPPISDNFPLFDKKYSARIHLIGQIKNSTIELEVNDRRLEDVVREVRQSIELSTINKI